MFSTKYNNNIRQVSGTVTIYEDDVVLECNTSSGSVVINLQSIPSNNWNTTWKLYVRDVSNNASVNNIVINAGTGQLINGTNSLVINSNGGGCVIRVLDNSCFLATLSYCCGSSQINFPKAYAHIAVYRLDMETVFTMNPIVWTNLNPVVSNFSLVAKNTQLQANISGAYEFNFEVTGYQQSASTSGRAYCLYINGVATVYCYTNMDNIQSPPYTAPTPNGVEPTLGKVVGNGLLRLNAGDTISLVNIGLGTDNIVSGLIPGTANVGASFYINKIDN